MVAAVTAKTAAEAVSPSKTPAAEDKAGPGFWQTLKKEFVPGWDGTKGFWENTEQVTKAVANSASTVGAVAALSTPVTGPVGVFVAVGAKAVAIPSAIVSGVVGFARDPGWASAGEGALRVVGATLIPGKSVAKVAEVAAAGAGGADWLTKGATWWTKFRIGNDATVSAAKATGGFVERQATIPASAAATLNKVAVTASHTATVTAGAIEMTREQAETALRVPAGEFAREALLAVDPLQRVLLSENAQRLTALSEAKEKVYARGRTLTTPDGALIPVKEVDAAIRELKEKAAGPADRIKVVALDDLREAAREKYILELKLKPDDPKLKDPAHQKAMERYAQKVVNVYSDMPDVVVIDTSMTQGQVRYAALQEEAGGVAPPSPTPGMNRTAREKTS